MPPRPSSLVRDVRDTVDDVLLVAMAKDPAERFDSGEELADALEGAARGTTSAAIRQRARQLEAKQPWGAGHLAVRST
jgi:hypothetical protein